MENTNRWTNAKVPALLNIYAKEEIQVKHYVFFCSAILAIKHMANAIIVFHLPFTFLITLYNKVH